MSNVSFLGRSYSSPSCLCGFSHFFDLFGCLRFALVGIGNRLACFRATRLTEIALTDFLTSLVCLRGAATAFSDLRFRSFGVRVALFQMLITAAFFAIDKLVCVFVAELVCILFSAFWSENVTAIAVHETLEAAFVQFHLHHATTCRCDKCKKFFEREIELHACFSLAVFCRGVHALKVRN
ncbi:hypothetical protein JZX86_27565 [Agrobacterium rosae]|nr:hypothetical protein [Agrobacterium rosae]